MAASNLNSSRLLTILLLALLCLSPAVPVQAEVESDSYGAPLNIWPLLTRWDGGLSRMDEITAAGPFFSFRSKDEATILAFRPLFVKFDYEVETPHWHIIYPVFNFYKQSQDNTYHWSLLTLVRRGRSEPTSYSSFEFWPFWLSRHTGEPESSYWALWPLHGTLKNRLFRERIDFTLWPLWVRTENNGRIYRHFPYPFLRMLSGEDSSGFGVWPIYGSFQQEDIFSHTWALWPLIFNRKNWSAASEQPHHLHGFLPFYNRETAAGMKSLTVVWPFFGYTREFEPRVHYSEARLLWPFWVQGRGDEKHINRWLPVFSHETVGASYRKNWYAWPLLRTQSWYDQGRSRQSVLFFLYWNETQQVAEDAVGRKTFLWPLFGNWSDGQGRHQFQTLDPLSVFFRNNRKIQQNWSPLFAVYRYDRTPESSRHSLLWNLLTLERGEQRSSLSVGPLYSRSREAEDSKTSILGGLIGWRRDDGDFRMSFFWTD